MNRDELRKLYLNVLNSLMVPGTVGTGEAQTGLSGFIGEHKLAFTVVPRRKNRVSPLRPPTGRPGCRSWDVLVPDDLQLFELPEHWASEPVLHQQILVSTPQALFEFLVLSVDSVVVAERPVSFECCQGFRTLGHHVKRLGSVHMSQGSGRLVKRTLKALIALRQHCSLRRRSE